jgi:hypothetical protein
VVESDIVILTGEQPLPLFMLQFSSTQGSNPVNLTAFTADIAWVTRLDQEPELYAERDALYVDFYSTVDAVSKAAPDTVCLDLYDGDSWVAWEDATITEGGIDAPQRFRWIVTAD